jgi:hypothetical protein
MRCSDCNKITTANNIGKCFRCQTNVDLDEDPSFMALASQDNVLYSSYSDNPTQSVHV